jgi:iron complex outermembrane receptor protein
MQRRFAAYARASIYKCFRSAAAIALVATFVVLNTEPANALTSSKLSFDIPAEDLGKALRDFAVQASCNISYDPTSVEHLHAPAIKGDFTVAEVLSRILSGTHLHSINIDQNTIQVLDTGTSRGDTNGPSGRAMIHFDYAKGPPTDADTQAQSNVSINTAPAERGAAANTSDQQKTAGLEEIVVTGTNITGVDNKTVPLLTFDRDAIDRSGYATISDFITSLPQNLKSAGNSPDGVLAPGLGLDNVENSTAANLRGLGANSTLTLINGHRVAAAAYGSGVDLSMIPLSAVERIDVLTDGSSAVYGSDAVGGVINIVLRKDFNGAETSARLDTLGRGGGELKQVGQSIGKTWGSGGALAVLQFDDSNRLRADQRTFTENIPQPTDVLPQSKRYSGIVSAHQSLAPSIEIFADGLIEHYHAMRDNTLSGNPPQIESNTSTTNSTSVNAGLRWQPFGDWHLEANALFSQIDTVVSEYFNPAFFGYTNGAPFLRNLNTIKEGDMKLDGTLWSHAASSIKAAIGAAYRQEAFSSLDVSDNIDRPFGRHVHATFVELYAPLIGPAYDIPLIKRLELSAAVRDDSYSDFGSKINPRFGIYWSPVGQVGLRAAYSTSFRAPNPVETQANATEDLFVESGFPQPNDPTGNTGALFYANHFLNPETSRNITAGLDFEPTVLPGTRFTLNYYQVIYSNRIISSPVSAGVFLNPQIYGPLIKQFPNDAAVDAFVASLQPPQQVFDFTNDQTGLSGVRFGFPYGYINAAKETTQGLDLGVHSMLRLSDVDKIVLDLNATYIKELETTFCSVCVSTNLVDTYGQPLKLRLRAGAGWSNTSISTNAAVNYANAYSDTNLIPPGRIAAFVTADLNATWRIRASGTSLSINMLNAFNSNPPLTGPALNKVLYDPNNADPRGRVLSFQLRQSW